jgi:hypothetical protein
MNVRKLPAFGRPVAVAILGGILGCTTAPTVRVGMSEVSFEDVVVRSDRQDSSLRTLRGEGNLRIETPAFSQSATFEVSILKPDSLYLRLSGPFGITVGNALVTRRNFQVYLSLQNRLYVGDTSPENFEKALRISLTFDDILSLFTGGTVLAGDRTSPSVAEADGADAVFLFEEGRYRRRYVIDPQTLLIRKLQFLDDKGAPVGEQAFSVFESREELTLPRIIMLTQHENRRRLTLHYDVFEWNAPPHRLTFSVPSNAERIELK